MHKFVWLTDIHLDLANSDSLFKDIATVKPDSILIGGDIGESRNPEEFTHLRQIGDAFDCPIYFVLGNHDYYFGLFNNVNHAASKLHNEFSNLKWLRHSGVVEFTPDTALIGHGAWADGRLGDYANSIVTLNDYILIDDFRGSDKTARLQLMKRMGGGAAIHIRHSLLEALQTYRNVYLLTHVPPFEAACWHEGRPSNNDFLPHFACGAVGDMLVDVMNKYPKHNLKVLCGHTHSGGLARITDNILVRTGDTKYGSPKIQRVFEV